MRILLSIIVLFILKCSDSDSSDNQISERETLDKLKKEIIYMADQSQCGDEESCQYIGLGSKPCGGNWEYLIYSTSIDEEELIFKVSHYNSLEKKYNLKYQIVSDCRAVLPPSYLDCIDGKCVAVYE